MRRQVIISSILIVVLLGAGGAGAYFLILTAPTPPTRDNEGAALLVRARRLAPQTVVEPIVGYGTARADRHVWVAAQVSGEVIELHPDLHVGTAVEAGELLVRLDDREYQHRLDRARSLLDADQAQFRYLDVEERNYDRLLEIAQAELEIAERERQRVMTLFESGQAPRRELDVALQGFELARRTLRTLENDKALLPEKRATQLANRDLHRADVALAQLDVERCGIHAPFRGRLEAVEVEVGQRVSVGSRLFALLDPDLIEVPIELPVSLRERVASNAPCRLTLESNRNVAWSGRVARVAPRADETTRTFSLFVEVDNTAQEPPLMPGVFVRAQIDGPIWRDALVVPRGTTQEGHVYIFDNGLARRRAVQTERHLLGHTIISGLDPGALVITSNLDALFDGAPVRVEREDSDEPRLGESPVHSPPALDTVSGS